MREFIFPIILSLSILSDLNAQTFAEADPKNWTTYNSSVSFENGEIHLKNDGDGSALLWLNDTEFKNGTVELDIKGKNKRGQSFLGLAFHGINNTHYDAVYFRPFNFRSTEKMNHAIQYIHSPKNVWHVLREKFPGEFENSIQPVPDPDDWFRVKIEINTPNIKVYINGSDKPSLAIKKISNTKEGKLGLWIDSQDGWFRNITFYQN